MRWPLVLLLSQTDGAIRLSSTCTPPSARPSWSRLRTSVTRTVRIGDQTTGCASSLGIREEIKRFELARARWWMCLMAAADRQECEFPVCLGRGELFFCPTSAVLVKLARLARNLSVRGPTSTGRACQRWQRLNGRAGVRAGGTNLCHLTCTKQLCKVRIANDIATSRIIMKHCTAHHRLARIA